MYSHRLTPVAASSARTIVVTGPYRSAAAQKEAMLPAAIRSGDDFVKTDCPSMAGTKINPSAGSKAAGHQFAPPATPGFREATTSAGRVCISRDGSALWGQALSPVYIYKRRACQKFAIGPVKHVVETVPIRPANDLSLSAIYQ